jgi:hypothetical protein
MYLPALSIVAIFVGLVGIGWSDDWGGVRFSDSLTQMRMVVIGPMTILILAVILIVERLRPAQRRPSFARGYRQDALYALLNASLVAPLVVALSLSLTDAAKRYLPWIVVHRLELLPRWAVISLIFVLMDGCNWLAHFANHRIRVLWRFHELHHSQEDMSVLTVFRTHPLIHVSYLIALIPGIATRGLRRLCGIRTLEYQSWLRAAGKYFCESELPPNPSQAGWPTGREPWLRADNLGPDIPSCGVPDRGDDQDRHRVAWSTPRRGTVR